MRARRPGRRRRRTPGYGRGSAGEGVAARDRRESLRTGRGRRRRGDPRRQPDLRAVDPPTRRGRGTAQPRRAYAGCRTMAGSAAVTASVVGDVADLISVIIWPALIVGVLWFLREPVSAFAARVGSSAQRVTVGAQGLSVALSSAIETVPRQSATALAGVRAPDPAPRVVDSAAMTMFAQLEQEEPAPYLVVDLGAGREWLTTRLYIFSSLLRATRRTRTLSFVETAGGVRGRFTGLASTERVRYALAHAYPWLEAHYADAYAGATVNYRTPASVDTPFIVDDQGRLLLSTAHTIATRFVFAVQQKPPPPKVTEAPGWVIEQRPTERSAERRCAVSHMSSRRLPGCPRSSRGMRSVYGRKRSWRWLMRSVASVNSS